MSQQHKDAIRRSRRDNRGVGAYLEALRASGTRRGRRRTLDRIDDELRQTAAALVGSPSPVEELHLVQRRRDLEAERQTMLTPSTLPGWRTHSWRSRAVLGTQRDPLRVVA